MLHSCPYKKALLACGWHCANAQRELPAVPASLGCLAEASAQRCAHVLALTAQRARFALGRADPGQPLSHGQVMKLKCGGLEGLRRLQPQAAQQGIDAMLDAVVARYGALEELPFEEVVRAVAGFRLRSRKGGR